LIFLSLDYCIEPINSQKITVNRFTNLENEDKDLKKAVKNIKEDKKELQISRGVFYEGQVYDAYVLINDIFKTAKNEIALIDNYIDDMVLTLFSKYPNLNYIIITKTTSKQLQPDIKKYQARWKKFIHIS
jgi:hypothetical protein